MLLTAPAFALTGGSPAGGTWSGPGVANGLFTSGAAGLGTHGLTYTYTNRFGCSTAVTQPVQVVRVLGQAEAAGVGSLTLSPNPASGATTVTFSTVRRQAPRVQLLDALGHVVREQALPLGTEHALTLALPTVGGVYHVRLLLADGVLTRARGEAVSGGETPVPSHPSETACPGRPYLSPPNAPGWSGAVYSFMAALVSLADPATARRVAGWLLDSEAVRLRPAQPFTWSSGWRSPIYCDNRVTLAFPEIRTAIAEALVAATQQHFPTVESIGGVATAGIAQGALLADRLALPYCYVRPQPKSHGMGNQIEGRILPGQRVVLVEDLISTGGSSLKAAEALRTAGAEVIGMLAVFTYGFPQAERAFAAAGIPLVCLSDYGALLTEATARGVIAAPEVAHLTAWREAPEVWGK